MSKHSVGLALLTVGLMSLMLERGSAPPPSARSLAAGGRFRLERDLPALGLMRACEYHIDTAALIYLGDPVAVRGEAGEVLLMSYQDELMGSVIGRVVA